MHVNMSALNKVWFASLVFTPCAPTMRMSFQPALPVHCPTHPQTVLTANQRGWWHNPTPPPNVLPRSILWLTHTHTVKAFSFWYWYSINRGNYNKKKCNIDSGTTKVKIKPYLNSRWPPLKRKTHSWFHTKQTYLFPQNSCVELLGVRLFTLMFTWWRHIE